MCIIRSTDIKVAPFGLNFFHLMDSHQNYQNMCVSLQFFLYHLSLDQEVKILLNHFVQIERQVSC